MAHNYFFFREVTQKRRNIMFVVFESTNASPHKVAHVCMALGVPKAVFHKSGTVAVQMPSAQDAQDAAWVFSKYPDMVQAQLGDSCRWVVLEALAPGFSRMQLSTTKAEA